MNLISLIKTLSSYTVFITAILLMLNCSVAQSSAAIEEATQATKLENAQYISLLSAIDEAKHAELAVLEAKSAMQKAESLLTNDESKLESLFFAAVNLHQAEEQLVNARLNLLEVASEHSDSSKKLMIAGMEAPQYQF